MVNLCASQLPEGKTGFGWINPSLYKNGGIFYDIIGGNNYHSCVPDIVSTGNNCSAGFNVLKAYLTYNGSLGDTVFVVIKNTHSTFVTQTVHKDASIAFGFDINTGYNTEEFDFVIANFAEVKITIYDSDPDDGDTTVFLQSATLSTSCPGPWTIGSEIFLDSGLVLIGRTINPNPNPKSLYSGVVISENTFFGFEATEGWVSVNNIQRCICI